MGNKMTRGKNQIMYRYLPGYIFDFDKSRAIAQISHVRGIPKTDLNQQLILDAVREYASAWPHTMRGPFANPTRDNAVLLEPRRVEAQLFPNVFWCQNRSCGRVFVHNDGRTPNSNRCSVCRQGQLTQMPFVTIHQCGDVRPLQPPYQCDRCHQRRTFALDKRGERISNFKWRCTCGNLQDIFAGYCRTCNWQTVSGNGDAQLRRLSIQPHRANSVFRPHNIVLLNQPGTEADRLLSLEQWEAIVAGFYFDLPDLTGRTIYQFARQQQQTNNAAFSLSQQDVDNLKAQGRSDAEIQAFQAMQAQLFGNRQQAQQAVSGTGIAQTLRQLTGVHANVWQTAGRELLETQLPYQSDRTEDLFALTTPNATQQTAQQMAGGMGLEKLSLAADFPMTYVTFGYSRLQDQPGDCQLRAFPADDEHRGKFPLFVDLIQADAIIVRLDPHRVLRWLLANALRPTIPVGATDQQRAERAYFVNLFHQLQQSEYSLKQTLDNTQPITRMTFGLLHTMSHQFLKKAALLCGLDQTSLAEYILPSSLSFAIYCNHRAGATIGAFSSLFEQSLPHWLGQIRSDTRRCLYDPVCQAEGANCHACTHISETSCRFFNLNLGRSFLFGGEDTQLGAVQVGYWSNTLNAP